MRVLAAALAVLLLVAICSLAQGSDRGYHRPLPDTVPTTCCFSTISRPPPRRMIQSAYMTSSSCPINAVVLVTRKGRQVCADPQAAWLQKYLKELELQDFWLFPSAAPGPSAEDT